MYGCIKGRSHTETKDQIVNIGINWVAIILLMSLSLRAVQFNVSGFPEKQYLSCIHNTWLNSFLVTHFGGHCAVERDHHDVTFLSWLFICKLVYAIVFRWKQRESGDRMTHTLMLQRQRGIWHCLKMEIRRNKRKPYDHHICDKTIANYASIFIIMFITHSDGVCLLNMLKWMCKLIVY